MRTEQVYLAHALLSRRMGGSGLSSQLGSAAAVIRMRVPRAANSIHSEPPTSKQAGEQEVSYGKLSR